MMNIKGSIIIICTIFLFVSGNVSGQNNAQITDIKPELIGKLVPDFTMKTLSGEIENLMEIIGGKRSIIYFWATWCPNCKEKLQYFDGAKEQLKNDGIALAVVNLGEKKKIVQKFMDKHKININTFLDEQSVLQDQYQLIGLPTLVYVDEQGLVKNIHHVLPGEDH